MSGQDLNPETARFCEKKTKKKTKKINHSAGVKTGKNSLTRFLRRLKRLGCETARFFLLLRRKQKKPEKITRNKSGFDSPEKYIYIFT